MSSSRSSQQQKEEDPETSTSNPLLLKALQNHQVHAEVTAVDHFRIRGGLAVESDYIVTVQPSLAVRNSKTSSPQQQSCPGENKKPQNQQQPLFASFELSKTYSAFRALSQQLHKATAAHDLVRRSYEDAIQESVPAQCFKLAKYCQLVRHLINSQSTRYLGKVNYLYVKILAKQRTKILNDVLDATMHYFPTATSMNQHAYCREVAMILQTFFLTDHCVSHEEDDEGVSATTANKANASDSLKKSEGPLGLLKRVQEDVKDVRLDDLNPLNWLQGKAAGSEHSQPSSASIVVPLSHRQRRTVEQRDRDNQDLSEVAGEEAKLLLDDDRPPTELLPSYAQPRPVVSATKYKFGIWLDNNPIAFFVICVVVVRILEKAGARSIRLDADIALLVVFASFCLGLHTPRPMVGGFDRPPTMMGAVEHAPALKVDVSGSKLMRRSLKSSVTSPMAGENSGSFAASPSPRMASGLSEESAASDVVEDEATLQSPMAKYPEDAPIGEYTNRWSDPPASDFEVRGSDYLKDRVKVRSDNFLFPCRGLDLFLTDTCPSNVGQNPHLFGGRLREMPTFIINFRLPWGVLLLYFEIPKTFVPFVMASASGPDDAKELPPLENMTPSERSVCRFLMHNQTYKNETLKLIPVVIDGPWVVRSVVGGKPAIIGNKLPVVYSYEPGEDGKELYLEADLDIASSQAARGILSVVRSYTQILTLNLGFVVQGNKNDELPEQMLVGVRLHGIDPLTAPAYPQVHESFLQEVVASDDDLGSI